MLKFTKRNNQIKYDDEFSDLKIYIQELEKIKIMSLSESMIISVTDRISVITGLYWIALECSYLFKRDVVNVMHLS